MKFCILLGAVSLAGYASAFWGQMAASDYENDNGQTTIHQIITLTDYNTGSIYTGLLPGGFNGCVASHCAVTFGEAYGNGFYKFKASMWKTNDGCHNIDFQGALDAGHGYCCGSLPCDLSA
ncbi:uncharacterized protein N7473_000969 [Penicillium subrubescens]|nr:uncharacterized protein N7473_000969 [Penicillium subrubescens]KAJ5911666.1 hypothetical protein N7473_000969 [Penicillium subrubescens]